MLARASSRDSQAWTLIQLAHTLRRRGRRKDALTALDLAAGLHRSATSELAAYACAVAVHFAGGDAETARKVSDSARRRAGEAGLMRTLGRLHLELFHETGGPLHLDEAFACFELAALEEAAAS